ncbi:MAG: rane-bound dehydrogenase domain protein [Phycisphaerales bacterium]|nr:rane-bound dehydrogenase domain protein [Phycisphaerales bacterium]
MKHVCMMALACLLGFSIASPSAIAAEGKKKIIFIAGTQSHEWGGHEHRAGCELLAKCLNESMGDKVEAKVYSLTEGWPKAEAFDGADAVVIYCDGGNGHPAIKHLQELDDLAKKGVGIGCLHYGVEPGDGTKQPDGRAEFSRWMGGYFETFYSINPHWTADVTSFPSHPAASGLKPFSTNDEWYYHMRFRPNMAGVTGIISAVPPDDTRKKKDDPHNGNPEVRSGIGKGLVETMVWVAENKDPAYNGQRGFGCTGGHVHWNWAQDSFRKAILNAIVWTAKGEVPTNGVESKRPTVQDLLANMDKKKDSGTKSEEWIAKYVEEVNQPKGKQAAAK